jgi:acyl-CoA oxidase
MRRLDSLLSTPALRGIWPVLYVAWADAVLTPDEVREILEVARELPGLDVGALAVLSEWMVPDSPPSAAELAGLRERIREELGASAFESLAEAGLALLDASCRTAEQLAGLRLVESAAGVHGAAAARALLAADHPPVSQHFEESRPV